MCLNLQVNKTSYYQGPLNNNCGRSQFAFEVSGHCKKVFLGTKRKGNKCKKAVFDWTVKLKFDQISGRTGII